MQNNLQNPLYETTLRILVFRKLALERRTPWPLREAAAQMELHPRTLKRYITMLSLIDHDHEGHPLIQLEHTARGVCIVIRQVVYGGRERRKLSATV